MTYGNERRALLQALRAMLASGLTTGAGGNISVRLPEGGGVLVSPTGIHYSEMLEDDLVVTNMDGAVLVGSRIPTSELSMHLAIYTAREDCGAVVHTHSPYASTFACLREEIPAVHYLVGFAGMRVPVADYATYGTTALARNALSALGEGNAVLLANHGLLAIGRDLASAYAVAEEIELVARLYYQARSIGAPVLLDDAEMKRVIDKFRSYGRQDIGEGS